MTPQIAEKSAAKLQLCHLGNGVDLENKQYDVCIPLHTRRAVTPPGHRRWKAENFFSNVYCAWDAKGLHVEFVNRIRDVHNTAPLNKLWSEECFEIFLDVRNEQTAFFAGNSYQIFIAPPFQGDCSRFFVRDNRSVSGDMQVKTHLTANGWGGKVFIPWTAFPGFEAKEGAEIGLGFQVSDDYGRPQNTPFFSAQYLCFDQPALAWDARKLPRWVLKKSFQASEQNDLRSVIAVDLPRMMMTRAVDCNIVIADLFKKRVGSISWSCDFNGKKLSGVAENNQLHLELPPDSYGEAVLDVQVADPNGKILGHISLPFVRLNGEKLHEIMQQSLELLQKADLAEMSAKEPEKAAHYFGLLNNLEQLKRLIFLEKSEHFEALCSEMQLRMQLLQGKEITTDDPLFELLKISSSLDAQVSVEFPRYHPNNRRGKDAKIKFFCGAVPLARVNAEFTGSPQEFSRRWVPAVYSRQMLPTENKDHLLFSFTAQENFNHVIMCAVDSLDFIPAVQAVVIVSNATAEHKAAAEKYAAKHNVPIIREEDITGGMRVLYAGRPAKDTPLDKLFSKGFRLNWVTPGRNDLELNLPNGIKFMIRCISAAGCELIADVLTGKRAFTKAENRKLTQLIAEELTARGIKKAAIPQGYELVAADIHCHSIYSDGVLTPLGLIAAALYTQMDFLLISDHETAEGVLNLQRLFREYGFKFPLIAGEENSLPDGHLNSYPLTESIPFGLSFEKLLEAAHAQGALVQYNHPATYSNRRDLQSNGIAGSGLEAWEHELPPHAEKWAELPALVGSSDNHNTAFPTERTITVVKSIDGKTFLDAVRRKATGILEAAGEKFVYAPEAIQGMLLTALYEPEKYLLQGHYKRLHEALKNADIAGLYRSQPGSTPIERGE